MLWFAAIICLPFSRFLCVFATICSAKHKNFSLLSSGKSRKTNGGNSNGEMTIIYKREKLYFHSIENIIKADTKQKYSYKGFVKNHAAFVEIGETVGTQGELAHSYPQYFLYLWAQSHLLIVFIHARKGLIILGNLYLLIGSSEWIFLWLCK